MQSAHLAGILETLRRRTSAEAKWRAIFGGITGAFVSPLWASLPAPNIEQDVRRARAFLVDELGRREAPRPPRGLHLGLDLRNMHGPAGYNLELAATRGCDPESTDGLWVWNCEWRGRRHRIESLRAMCEATLEPDFAQLRSVAVETLPIGYAGLVLSEALTGLEVTSPLLAVYGLHDGDLFTMARRSVRDTELIFVPVDSSTA